MKSDPFFQSGMKVTIEARGIGGEPAAMEDRNCYLALKKVTQKAVVGVMIAASMTGSASGTVGSFLDQHDIKAPAAAMVITNGDQAYEALSSISPTIQKSISEFKVINKKLDGRHHSGPALLTKSLSGDKSSCTVSMFRINNLRLNEQEQQVYTRLTLLHEAAHCEYNVASIKPSGGKINEILSMVKHYSVKISQSKDAKTGFGIDIKTIMAERYADGKAMLVEASNIFAGAETQSQINKSLKEFDFAMGMAMQQREYENIAILKSYDNFNTHDTMPVLKAISNMVHNAASSPKLMSVLKTSLLDGDNASIAAAILAIGSTRSGIKFIYENQLSDAIATARVNGQNYETRMKIVKSLVGLRGKSDEVLIKDGDFGKEMAAKLSNADKTFVFAMSSIDGGRLQVTSQLGSNLIKRLAGSEMTERQGVAPKRTFP